MAGIRRWIVTIAVLVLMSPAARAQAVAFQPVVGAIQNGPTLGVVPSVSFDRRYVRLGVNSQFIGFEGFNTFLVPAAVGGGPGGPGALAGGQFLAGMDGVIGPSSAYGSMGGPQDYGFMGNQAPADNAQPGFGGMPERPRADRATQPRTKASKALRRGRTPKEKTKQPASAGASATGLKAGSGR